MTDELRNEAAEAFVRSLWTNVNSGIDCYEDLWIDIVWMNGEPEGTVLEEFRSWPSAGAFTRAKQEEAWHIEEEIAYLNYDPLYSPNVVHRIKVRLESALASARRGMKENYGK